MHSFSILFSALVAVSACVDGAVISGPRYHKVHHSPKNGTNTTTSARTPKALYFITNDANNSVVAIPISKNGTLSDGSLTATGGAGSNEVDATGKPLAPDALSSQGSVRVAGKHVFAVNAGSNTLSMFKISAHDPTKLTLVGNPIDTAGDFPVTLAISTKHSLACVANTGAKAGIACASFDAKKGLSKMDTLRQFALNQSTPPVGPTNTVADTFFNNHETALITTIKGDPTVNNTGFMSIFPMTGAKGAKGAKSLSTAETRSSPPGTAVLFGSVNIPGTNSVLATDASFGALIMDISENNTAATSATAKLADQKATCWATISPATGTGFVTDVGVNHIVEVDLANMTVVKDLTLTNGNPGMIDLEAAGDFIYALSPGTANVSSAVTVFDVSGGRGSVTQIQNFNPKGVSQNAQGMAVLI
ncbi:hypothetical protein MMC14_005598 [Varicellaria rhodocarpa]|nr:hypothetical protein [Varicellaria rhodocarpa]